MNKVTPKLNIEDHQPPTGVEAWREKKQYEPESVEKEVYSYWEKGGFLSPDFQKRDKKSERFTIILPPPNANGSLHLGHASGYSYQDLMGRYNRMKGKEVLLLPGKDHAGIQTEVVFEKELEKKGIKKRQLGREEFYKQCYEFCMTNSVIARNQEKKLGTSADYSRELFTLDPRIKKTVFEIFVQMFQNGLIYRGKRIINWCPRCKTALADIDTETRKEISKLYYIKYGPFVIATTRPETKFADTAIAVNPKDARYKKYIDTEVDVVSVEGIYKLPVIADYDVDMKFGTGVLKVTPGHSMEDFKIGLRHNLPVKTVIDFEGRMTNNTKKYKGMKVKEAREEVVKDLKSLKLIEKIEEHESNIKICERCKSVIEPLISYQWFVKTDSLKSSAIKALNEGKISFHPQRQEKNCIHWLQIPEDWCISRQLWWGYQIPAWYCGGKIVSIDETGNITENYGIKDGCGNIIVSAEKPQECPKCKRKNLVQDEDILDTWYSSGQWPYATLLANSDSTGVTDENDFERYFPTQVLATGRDIIFFWVARMMMFSLYKYQVPPFSDVYLYGIVLDKNGIKQSKSRNNGVDPMLMINKFGADALRLSFIVGNGADQDYKLYEEKIKGFRNFINKIWNAFRFIMIQIDSIETDKEKIKKYLPEIDKNTEEIDMIKTNKEHINMVDKYMKEFKFGRAGEEIYAYFWHKFCDIDLETVKDIILEKDLLSSGSAHLREKNIAILLYILENELKIMHPFIPFITEYIWQLLKESNLTRDKSESIMYTNYPDNGISLK